MKQGIIYISFLIACSIIYVSCDEETDIDDTNIPIVLPYDDTWPEQYINADNLIIAERIELGRHLFYDKRVSRDSTISCSSCHLQSHAFSDTIAISPGVNGRLSFRNAPSLMNTVFVDRAHKDGGVNSIDLQAISPIEDHAEMDISINHVVDRLKGDPNLQALSEAAYDRPIDRLSIIFGLAAFVKSLSSTDSKYDAYIAGDYTLSNDESKGLTLFEQHCATCHVPPYFGSNEQVNNGSGVDYTIDEGRYRITLDSADIGKFRVSSLRNIALTAPYMADGHIAHLEDVIEHYDRGGSGHINQDQRVKALFLNPAQKQQIVSFLHTLTDPTIATKKEWMPPEM